LKKTEAKAFAFFVAIRFFMNYNYFDRKNEEEYF